MSVMSQLLAISYLLWWWMYLTIGSPYRISRILGQVLRKAPTRGLFYNT